MLCVMSKTAGRFLCACFDGLDTTPRRIVPKTVDGFLSRTLVWLSPDQNSPDGSGSICWYSTLCARGLGCETSWRGHSCLPCRHSCRHTAIAALRPLLEKNGDSQRAPKRRQELEGAFPAGACDSPIFPGYRLHRPTPAGMRARQPERPRHEHSGPLSPRNSAAPSSPNVIFCSGSQDASHEVLSPIEGVKS